jgi:hypothetical protein
MRGRMASRYNHIIERHSGAALQIGAAGTSAPLMPMYRYYFLDAADHVSAPRG